MTTEQQLPEGWKKFNLFDICQPKQWKTIATKDLKNEGYPVYGANGIIGYYHEYNHDVATVLLTCRGATCGEVHISKPYSYINGNAMCMDNLSDNTITEFLYYYLKSINLNFIISGSAQPQITQIGLRKVEIPIPPLETQQAIVNKIESLFAEIDEGIGRLKTAEQQIQQYRQSLLKNAFNGELTKEWRSKHADALPSENELLAQIQTTREQHHAQQLADWQNITIGEVVTISPKKEKAIDDDTDVSFSSMHLMSSSLSEHLTYEIKKWADVKKGFTVFRNNDVLLAKITPCFENGKSAVAQDLINGIGTGSTEFMVLRCSNQILPKFLYFLVNTPEFRQAGIHNMTGSVGHKRVPKDFVSTWAFSLPPLAEQTEIVAILESKLTACDQLAAELAKQLKQAELLKQAVLKAAFSGSLLDK